MFGLDRFVFHFVFGKFSLKILNCFADSTRMPKVYVDGPPSAKRAKTVDTSCSTTNEKTAPKKTTSFSDATIQQLASYVDKMSPDSQKSPASGENSIMTMDNWDSNVSQIKSANDAKVEAAAADFVRSYLSADDNDESGNGLLNALGLGDDSSSEFDSLNCFDLENSPNTAVVQPKSPYNFLGTVTESNEFGSDSIGISPNLEIQVSSVQSKNVSVDKLDSCSRSKIEAKKEKTLTGDNNENGISESSLGNNEGNRKRKARIEALETTLKLESEPWNDQLEAMSLISKMQSNLASTSQGDPWGDSTDSDS